MTILQTQNSAAGPLTLDDVRTALGDTDPRTTNAGALRARLGRGSTSTIQKHLEKLRSDLVPALPVDTETPSAPADAVAAIWSAAWSAAQAQTLGRLNLVTLERDTARERVALLESDLFAATSELDQTVDTLAGTQSTAETTLQAERASAAAAQLTATEQIAGLRAELSVALANYERLTVSSAHSEELARRDAELRERAHQQDREHLLNQIAELKSALHRPTAAE